MQPFLFSQSKHQPRVAFIAGEIFFILHSFIHSRCLPCINIICSFHRKYNSVHYTTQSFRYTWSWTTYSRDYRLIPSSGRPISFGSVVSNFFGIRVWKFNLNWNGMKNKMNVWGRHEFSKYARKNVGQNVSFVLAFALIF